MQKLCPQSLPREYVSGAAISCVAEWVDTSKKLRCDRNRYCTGRKSLRPRLKGIRSPRPCSCGSEGRSGAAPDGHCQRNLSCRCTRVAASLCSHGARRSDPLVPLEQPPAPRLSSRLHRRPPPSPRLPHRTAYGDWPGLARRREREHGWVNHPGDGVERLMPKLLELAEFVRRIQDAVTKLHCVRVVH